MGWGCGSSCRAPNQQARGPEFVQTHLFFGKTKKKNVNKELNRIAFVV
jgi:hypothetical protein